MTIKITTVKQYNGKMLEDLSKEELIELVKQLEAVPIKMPDFGGSVKPMTVEETFPPFIKTTWI